MTGTFLAKADFDPGPRTSNLTSAGSQDIFVAKYSAQGALVWARSRSQITRLGLRMEPGSLKGGSDAIDELFGWEERDWSVIGREFGRRSHGQTSVGTGEF